MTNIIRYQEIAPCTACGKETEVTTYYASKQEKPLSLCEDCKRTYSKKNQNTEKHDLSPLGYMKMLIAQQGVCASCGGKETGRSRSKNIAPLAVDHNHTTGQIRGLLCRSCNIALGLLDEDPTKMLALAEYIKKFQ